MKKNLFLHWLLLFAIFFASCSDSNDPIIPDPDPDPDPEPPTEELVEGINQFPEEFDATKEAKIVFKASKKEALYGYTGDVYAHIGVVEGTTWVIVPSDWNTNEAKFKMSKVEGEEYAWSLTLSPDIRTWFGVSEEIAIHRIGLVARSADGKKQTGDFFLDVADEKGFTPGEVVFEAQPAGTVDGINIIDNSTVTFVLYDKDTQGTRKEYAYLIGDFNNWRPSETYQMKRDEATGCWWYTLTGLDAQTEYAFQYYVGDKSGDIIRLADAYTEKVLDPQDKDIPASTYPGLSYPENAFGVLSTFRTQPETYNWSVSDFKVDDKHNLVIYEMLFRDFTASGDVKGAMAKLDYLKGLGVNAIELMPVQEFDGNDSWGYNPCFFFALDKAYGTKKDYKDFIDACHERGMAVLFDVVYNHATGAHPFAKLYWNAAKNETAANNPWFNVKEPHPYGVFHDFNHESPLVRAFVKRNLQFLLNEYKIDGFRFDLTKGFTQNSSTESTASNYDASRVAILKDYNAAIKEVSPDAVVILEHFAVEKEEAELAKDGMMLWRNLNEAYCQTGMGWDEKSSYTAFVGSQMPFGGWVGYMESHDEERVSYKQTQWGNYTIQTDLSTRMKQLEVNSALFFTVPGPKMIWQFGELGYDVTIGNEEERTKPKPIKWEYYDNSSRKAVYDTYSKLISLRTLEKPELFVSSTNMEWAVQTSDWTNGRYVSLKSITGDGLVAVGNFTDKEIECTVNFQSAGTWYNYMKEDETLQVTSSTQKVKVPAHSFRVYVNF